MRMSFSRWRAWSRGRGRSLQNQKLGRNQGVLYKISCQGGRPARPLRPNALGREPRCSLQADRHVVSDHAAVAADGCERRHWDGFASSSVDNRGGHRATSVDYRESPGRIRGRPEVLAVPELHVPWGLTLRPTANGLVRSVLGRVKRLLAIRAAARWEKHFLRSMFGPNFEENRSVVAPQTI